MSTVSIVILVIVSILFILMIVPRILSEVPSAKLKGKVAPTLHAASASRIKSGKKTVLYFYTPPCGACKMQEPIIERVKKYASETVFKIDASRNQDAALAYGVMGVPFLVFVDGGKIVSAKAGVQSEASLKQFIG